MSAPKVTRFFSTVGCADGQCPAAALTEDGSLLVRGYKMAEVPSEIVPGDNEDVVKLPAEFVVKLLEDLASR